MTQDVSTDTTLLVAVDLEGETLDLGPVRDLAAATGWSVHLLYVAAPVPAFAGGAVGLAEVVTPPVDVTADREALARMARDLEARGITADAEVVVGATVASILERAAALGVAQIVVSGRRHNVAHRLILGSVVSSLLKSSPVPILVLAPTRPVDEAELTVAVDRLLEVIDREDASGMAGLRDAAAAQLAEPESDPARLGHQLRDALHRFESSHPSLTRAINDVSYYLSGMGL